MNGEHLHHDERMDWVLGGDHVHPAVIFIEGFDHLQNTAPLLTAKGWSAAFSSFTAGRFGGQAAIQAATAVTHALPSSYSTLILGFAIQVNGFTAGTDIAFLRAGATQTMRFSFDATPHIQIRNSGGTVIATGTTTIVANAWYYVEIKVFVNAGTPASGTVEVHLNGVSEIASTAGNFGSTNLDTLAIQGVSGRVTTIDDIYICDTSGSAPNNTFLGDTRVLTLYPAADGAHADWTPDTGTAHFSRVNEHTGTFPDGDTTYVADNVAGHQDTYDCDSIDGGATVFAVQTNLYARKDDAAVRQIAPVVRQAGTDYVGSTATLTSSFLFYSTLYDKDPTSAAWTATNVNADEYGIKTIA